jgi:hypothetical protein
MAIFEAESFSSGNAQPYLPYHLSAVVDKYFMPGTSYNAQGERMRDGMNSGGRVVDIMTIKCICT